MRNVGRCLQSVGRSLYPPLPAFPFLLAVWLIPMPYWGAMDNNRWIPYHATQRVIHACVLASFPPRYGIWMYHTIPCNSRKVFGCIHHRRSTICWPNSLLFRKIRDAHSAASADPTNPAKCQWHGTIALARRRVNEWNEYTQTIPQLGWWTLNLCEFD